MVVLRLLSRLPLSVLHGIGDLLYLLVYHALRFRRDIARDNIARAFPQLGAAERRQIERLCYRNMADVAMELLKTLTIPADELAARVRLSGIEQVVTELDAGRCVLLVSAHQCNWEWAYLACCLAMNYPIHSLYKPTRIASLERLMMSTRTRFGASMIPSDDVVADVLRNKGLVRALAMVADQTPRSKGKIVWLRFLNQDTAFFGGIERIARTMKYPVVFLGARRLARGQYHAEVTPLAMPEERLPAGEITRRYARAVELQIEADPPNWLWTYKRWNVKRPAVDD